MSRKVEVACEICGKVEIKNPSDAKRYKTCSLKCRGARSRILYSKKVEKECEVCGDVFEVKESHSKRRFTCSNECRYVRLEDHLKSLSGGSGEGSVNWRGGRFISPAGYSFVYDPENEMANARGYVREHRLVMSKHLKRPLTSEEVVHHIDGNKLNNDLSNLQLMTSEEHSRLHGKELEFERFDDGRIMRSFKREIVKGDSNLREAE